MKKVATNKSVGADEHEQNWRETYAMARPYITKGTVGIDVGCREGGFSVQMEKDFSHIYAFDFRDKWRKMFFENVNDALKFTYTAVGISDEVGTTYTKHHKAGRIKGVGTLAVPLRTIDSFNFENVGFIKYDIEGYETKAIKGSEQTIKKFTPVIVVEQNKNNLDAVELLKEWGYKLKGIDKMFNADYLMVKNV